VGQVIFLKPHAISREEEIRRAELQYFISSARIGMENRIISMPDYWKAIERQKHFNYLREKICIAKEDQSNI
jgi:hypothetical protein